MRIDISRFDFIDFGASKGGMITTARKVFGARAGLGIDLSENKVADMRKLGFECTQGDVTVAQFPENCVRFVTMSHILEHLPNIDLVRSALANAAFYARDFLFIQGHYFDADEMLARHGLKLFWSDWRGHPLHLTIDQLRESLHSLRLDGQASFFVRKRIRNSLHPAVHPIASLPDQHEWQEGIHPSKPFVLFEKPVWSEFACFVPLRDDLETIPDLMQKLHYERIWQPWRRRQIIVLGMHRSGTSCLSGLLDKSGAYFADKGEDIGCSTQNEKGFFERRDLRQACDLALYRAGADWNHVHAFSISKLIPQDADTCQQKFLAVFEKLDRETVWFAKEPRMCLLMPLLQGLLDEPVYVLAYRNPVEVAESLRKRNGFSLEYGVALWERYMCEALNQTFGRPRVLIRFADITTDPEKALSKLLDRLRELGTDMLHQPSAEVVRDFVAPTLHHHVADENRWNDLLNPQQRELAASLADGSALHRDNWSPSPQALSSIAAYSTNLEILLSEITELKIQRFAALETYEQQKNRVQILSTELQRLKTELQRERQFRQEIIGSLKWRLLQAASQAYRSLLPKKIANALIACAKMTLRFLGNGKR